MARVYWRWCGAAAESTGCHDVECGTMHADGSRRRRSRLHPISLDIDSLRVDRLDWCIASETGIDLATRVDQLEFHRALRCGFQPIVCDHPRWRILFLRLLVRQRCAVLTAQVHCPRFSGH